MEKSGDTLGGKCRRFREKGEALLRKNVVSFFKKRASSGKECGEKRIFAPVQERKNSR
jgi:hypothetical protein